MRIIGGSARGRKLAAISGRDIRPTPDRVREALFSILISRRGSLAGLRVLDLFAGSGALGLEALSRGAAAAVFVEQAGAAVKAITANLTQCGWLDRGTVHKSSVERALAGMAGTAPFDLVLLDPPYRQGLALRTLQQLSESGLLQPDSLICAEEAASAELPERIGALCQIDQRRYGTTRIALYALDQTGLAR